MTDQDDVAQGSPSRDVSGEAIDGASVEDGRRRTPARDCSSTESSVRWQDERMRWVWARLFCSVS